jgi:hypothetical protein
LSAQAQQGRNEKTLNEPQSTFDHRICRQERKTKQLPNGTSVTRLSVATKRSWKDENDAWQQKTQWHNVVAFGKGFAQLVDRLVKGAHVFVQANWPRANTIAPLKFLPGRTKPSSIPFRSSSSR